MLLRFLVVISLLLGFTSDSFSKSITLDQKKTVRIRGMITAAILLKGKEMLNISKDEREITLLINSQGGQVNTGLMFIDMMEIVKARGTKIRCVVPNLAASMAFHILAHCDSRYTLPSAILLWHPAKQSCLMCAMSAEDMIYSGTQLQLIEQPQNEYLIKAMNVPEEFFYFHYEHETLWAAYVLNNQVPGFIEIVKDIQGLDDFESMDSTTQNFYDTLADRMAKDF
jgi:ATP-dependent protease ClpP protease subunit